MFTGTSDAISPKRVDTGEPEWGTVEGPKDTWSDGTGQLADSMRAPPRFGGNSKEIEKVTLPRTE